MGAIIHDTELFGGMVPGANINPAQPQTSTGKFIVNCRVGQWWPPQYNILQ